MSDPLFTAAPHARDASSAAADRDAKIEQLLLAGLDHYFAGRYEHAINIWTRALFFDRAHPRARAYIDRARSALAERQRQSEALLHDGLAAFERGEGDEARRLLSAAIDGGAPADEAAALLGRLDRLAFAAPAGEHDPGAADTAEPPARAAAPRRAGVRVLFAVGSLVMVAAAGVLAAAAWDRLQFRALFTVDDAPAARARPVAYDGSLPIPRRAETALTRARALASAGHLRDALAMLDLVRPTDSQKAEADRLRADIQRELLNPGTARRVP